MYQLINRNAVAVVEAVDRIGDISAYARLRVSALSVDVTTDGAFQRTYRNYWRMNVARFGPAFYARYFALMGECRDSKSADVGRIIQVLSDIGPDSRGLQFSFATKLAHTVDPRVPVYDSFVAAFYFYVPPGSGGAVGDRISKLLEFHAFLQVEYARIIRDGLLADAISEFRTRRHVADAIPDERIIDWLLWAWVSHLRSGAQARGDALYA